MCGERGKACKEIPTHHPPPSYSSQHPGLHFPASLAVKDHVAVLWLMGCGQTQAYIFRPRYTSFRALQFTGVHIPEEDP